MIGDWRRGGVIVMLPLAIAACGPRGESQPNLDTLDNELVAADNSRDPALSSALEDQIMVDPALTAQANHDAVRPPAQPYSGAIPADDIVTGGNSATPAATATSQTLKTAPAPGAGPCPNCQAARESLTLGALAARQRDRRTTQCLNTLRYSTRWALRLPADLPLYPDARVTEAAGSEGGGCAVRIVSFATSAPLQKVIDWYYTRASNTGYSAEHQAEGNQHVLGGTRTRDDAAFALFVTPRRGGGTDVDLVANNGI